MSDSNISSNIGNIRVLRADTSDSWYVTGNWKDGKKVNFTEYNIKETDFRIKTASFVSPVFLDLTQGRHYVLINSLYHENFSGIILDSEYDEDSGLYTYQCQDWSRNLISKFELKGKVRVYDLLAYLILNGRAKYGTPYSKLSDNLKIARKGLKALDKYNQSYYTGNKYNGNPFAQYRQVLIRDKSHIDVLRDLVYGSLGYFDVWFNDKGVLQISPLSKTDWENTGLHLTSDGYSERKFKFSTTNAITSVVVNGQDLTMGLGINSKSLLDLNLSAFFGDTVTSVQNPNNQTKAVTTSSSGKSSSKNTSSSSSSSSKKTTTSNNGNPFNKKKKKIFVSADGGSCSFKSKIINLLKKDGWSVTQIPNCYGDAHSASYRKIDKSYAVNLTIFNGFCAGTVRECYDGWLKGYHEKRGVQLVYMWDTADWTNPKGMKPYRYGDFSGYNAKNAWDWNRGGDYHINNVQKYMNKYKVCYCCGPTPSEAYKQFKAGGYLKMNGLVK